MKKTLAAIGMLAFAMSCAKSAPQQPSTTQRPAAPAPVATNANQLAGNVVETFNGGGYTYLRIATSSGEEWAAVPEAKIEKGANVVVDSQLTMEKFESKTLNRTFDRIIFGSIAGANTTPPPMMSSSPAPAEAEAVKIEKPAGALTVAEVWSKRKSLNGKEVLVRGKVVKFLGGIMGTNWLHLQDGSGSRDDGDNDLTVTTDQVVKVGDVVTIKGPLAVDKDFGAGYRYEVIVEKATIEK